MFDEPFTDDRERASRFEIVETVCVEGREYHTLPNYAFLRQKRTGMFLRVHENELGLATEHDVTRGRRHQTREIHGFRLVLNDERDLPYDEEPWWSTEDPR